MTRMAKNNDFYPPALESWWLEQLRRCYPGKDEEAALRKLQKTVARISDLFTLERQDSMERAYHTPEDVLAYGLFYFPQTYARTVLALNELIEFRQWQPDPIRPVRILDIGCGSGASTCAIMEALSGRVTSGEIHGIDQGSGNIEAARSLTREWEPPGRTSWQIRFQQRNLQPAAVGPLALPRGSWDLIVLAFSLNELAGKCEDGVLGDWLARIVSNLAPGGVCLILEPALMETSTRLMSLRDWLIETTHLHLWGPCLHRQACPMLAEGKQWCHEVRRWTPPASLEFLNRKLFRDINHLKFSFLVLGRDAAPETPASENLFRTVSPVTRTAGKFSLRGCAADGQIHTYEWLQRHLDREQKDFIRFIWERGDIGDASNPEVLGSGLRIKELPGQSIRYSPNSIKKA